VPLYINNISLTQRCAGRSATAELTCCHTHSHSCYLKQLSFIIRPLNTFCVICIKMQKLSWRGDCIRFKRRI